MATTTVRFPPGRNARVTITRRTKTFASKIFCHIAGVEGKPGPVNYPANMPPAFENASAPTDVIVFDIPRTWPTQLELKVGTEFEISDTTQRNGFYTLTNEPIIVEPSVPGRPISYRCYVKKKPSPDKDN